MAAGGRAGGGPGTGGPLGDVADAVRGRADIVDVVGEFVALRPAGRSYKGLCPFHAEKTPSFTVSPERQLFYCFGCGAGGNVFTFLMRLQGLTFPEALRKVAERVGMGVEVERALAGGRPRDRRAGLLDALIAVQERASEWYAEQLWKSDEGERARRYLEGRGVDPAVARAFRLGYAPDGWHGLEKAVGRDSTTVRLLTQAGLLVEREDGLRYDRFRGRLMFAVMDARGRVVGFGGRALEQGQEPKYVNSPESPVYQKSRLLYGLDRAAATMRKGRRAVVVEGYMDVLAMHQFGLEEAVATCGTSLTPEHGRILARHAQQVVVAFDSDAAGQSAALRGLQQLRAAGLDVRVAVLPQPHDPDSLLKSDGRPAMEAVLEEARGIYEFAVEKALQGADLRTPAGKAVAVENVLPVLAEVPGAIEQEALVQLVARRLEVPIQAVRRELQRHVRTARAGLAHRPRPGAYNDLGSRAPITPGAAASVRTAAASRGAGRPGWMEEGTGVVERELLRLLIELPELAGRLRGRLSGEDFAGPGHGALFDALVEHGEAALADPELAALAGQLEASSELSMRADAVESYVRGLKEERGKRELASIEAKIEAVAGGKSDRGGEKLSATARLALLAGLAVSYREVWERLRSDGVIRA